MTRLLLFLSREREREKMNLQEAANDKRSIGGGGEECKEQTQRTRNQDTRQISGDKKRKIKLINTERPENQWGKGLWEDKDLTRNTEVL